MSSLTTLARPYARAAFEYANEHRALAPWQHALQLAAAIAADRDVRRLIGHPRVDRDALRRAFMPVSSAPDGFDNFIALLETNDRLAVLPQIARQFVELKDRAEQTLAVKVRSATELNEEYRNQLKRSLAKRFGKNIELQVEIDPQMLGGATIQAGDLVIDGSVRGKLQRMANSLTG